MDANAVVTVPHKFTKDEGSACSRSTKSGASRLYTALALAVVVATFCFFTSSKIGNGNNSSSFLQKLQLHQQRKLQESNSVPAECKFTLDTDSDKPGPLPNKYGRGNAKTADMFGFCERLPASASAAKLWRDNFYNNIDMIKATVHSDLKDSIQDPQYKHLTWINGLVKLMTPSIMEKSLRNSPGFADMTNALNIVHKRMTYMQEKEYNIGSSYDVSSDPDAPPPLIVVVYGGSIARGSGCETIANDIYKLMMSPDDVQNWNRLHKDEDYRQRYMKKIRRSNCPWPVRLQMFADAFAPKVIEFRNLAVGGTNTELALPLIKYELYPQSELKGRLPDIIINSYAANDNLYVSEQNTNNTRTTEHFSDSFNLAQEFIGTVLKSQPCHTHPPTIVYLDEYVGNQNDRLLGEDVRNDASRQMFDYYDGKVAYVTRGFVAKHFIMAHSNEDIMTPTWYDKRNRRYVDVHFGMAGHFQTALVLAYSALKATVQHCADVRALAERQQLDSFFEKTSNRYDAESNSLLNPHYGLPPELEILQSNWTGITRQAILDSRNFHETKQELCANTDINKKPCPFAFVASPVGTTPTVGSLAEYVKRHSSFNQGWESIHELRNGWQVKLGLVAREEGATVVFTLPNIANPVRVLTVQYLKSYGELWDGGMAEFNFTKTGRTGNETYERSTVFQLESFHESNTSIGYANEVYLNESSAEIGDTVNLKITLTHGPQFKILSLFMCSR